MNVEGATNYTKVSNLLDAVSTDIKHADNEDERFKDFTEILHKLGLCDTERKLTECYDNRKCMYTMCLFCKSQNFHFLAENYGL